MVLLVPSRFFITTPCSSAALPAPVTVTLVIARLRMVNTLMPVCVLPLTVTRLSDDDALAPPIDCKWIGALQVVLSLLIKSTPQTVTDPPSTVVALVKVMPARLTPPVTEMNSAPRAVVPVTVPPDVAESGPVPASAPSPVTVNEPSEKLTTMPLSMAPLLLMLRNVCEPPKCVGDVPRISSARAVPVVLMVLNAPVMFSVPPPDAVRPLPLVVLMTRLPPVKAMVAPALVVNVTALLVVVVSETDGLLKVIVPELQLLTMMPLLPLLAVMLPV